MSKQQSSLRGKLIIEARLVLKTGLHIGAASDFAPIGAVDSPFIRDPFTKQPIIPGSSLKGKMRTLLARSYAEGYWLNDIKDDPEIIQRLFGSANSDDNSGRQARLQFFDIKMTEDSVAKFSQLETDTYIGEVKFENTIGRLDAVANPRQIERVPAGAEFAFKLVYNIENVDEVEEDILLLADGLKLLQMDYIGGSGSRGYGRIGFSEFKVDSFAINPEKIKDIHEGLDEFKAMLEGSCL